MAFISFPLSSLEIYLIPSSCAHCGFSVITKKQLDDIGVKSGANEIEIVKGASLIDIPVFKVIKNKKVVCNAFRISNNSWVTSAHCGGRGELSLRNGKIVFKKLNYLPHPLYDGDDFDIALLTTENIKFDNLFSESKYTFDASTVETEQAVIVTHDRVEKVLYSENCQDLFHDKFTGFTGPCVLPARKDRLEITKRGDSGSPVFKVVEKKSKFEYYYAGILYRALPAVGFVYQARDFYFQNIFSGAHAIDYTTLMLILMFFKI